ncbi:MAG TPA: hypothetical protein VJH24_05820 [Candidatus Bilamarchaeaceae archaeon]|nr:hypothetical protein [Candidatus Bilamarchaeaceae archaeon]
MDDGGICLDDFSLSSRLILLRTVFSVTPTSLAISMRDFPFEAQGLSALPMYAYSQLFTEFLKQGITTVHMDGSEHPDLNKMKRRMGAAIDPTYWAVKLRDEKS